MDNDNFRAKAIIVNRGLAETGFGPYLIRLLIVGGLGWFFDNFWMFAISLISLPILREFPTSEVAWMVFWKYVGLVFGSTIWPLAANKWGRVPSFDISLISAGFCGFLASMAPNFRILCGLLCFVGFNTGGNQPVALMMVVELIPASHQHWLMYELIAWGFGLFTAAIIGWPLVLQNTCDVSECDPKDNRGWRYSYCVYGTMTFVLFLLRKKWHIHELPKFLAAEGENQYAVAVLKQIGVDNLRGLVLVSVTELDQVDREIPNEYREEVGHCSTQDRIGAACKTVHEEYRMLLEDKTMKRTTYTLWLIWGLCGMGFPLFLSFLPIYLNNKTTTLNQTYRDYAIQAVFLIPLGVLAGKLAQHPKLGRRGVGGLGGILTGVFMYLFIMAKPAKSESSWVNGYLIYNCCISFVTTLLYGALYAYTPEVFPLPLRAIAVALCLFWNRSFGLLGPIIALTMKINLGAPVFLSGALFIIAGCSFLSLPLETLGKAAM